MATKKAAQPENIVDVEIPQEDEYRYGEVDGIEFAIPVKKLASWKYMAMLKATRKAMQSGDLDDTIFTTVEVVEYLLGDQVREILDKLGEDASYNDVVDFYHKILAELNTKN